MNCCHIKSSLRGDLKREGWWWNCSRILGNTPAHQLAWRDMRPQLRLEGPLGCGKRFGWLSNALGGRKMRIETEKGRWKGMWIYLWEGIYTKYVNLWFTCQCLSETICCRKGTELLGKQDNHPVDISQPLSIVWFYQHTMASDWCSHGGRDENCICVQQGGSFSSKLI